MNPATEASYRKLAKHFYLHHMAGQQLTTKSICQRLVTLAPEFQPAYFRRLKNAISFELKERGYAEAAKSVLATVNPVTAPDSTVKRKPKRARAKSFSDEDLAALANHLHASGYDEAWAAVTLVRFTGVRPAEMQAMQVNGNVVLIFGAKKSHEGQRGADRILTFHDDATRSIVKNCLDILKSSKKSNDCIRHRLREEGTKLWPRRKMIPTLYSMRHQFGSNLKSSGSDARTIAYIMGHQSTSSVAVYGGRRQGDPTAIRVSPVQGTELGRIREKVKPQNWSRLEKMVFDSELEGAV